MRAGYVAGLPATPAPTPPLPPFGATYRLQMRGGMTLRRARDLVPYLDRLGISHLYTSPILCARPGSTHGYDVTDPGRLDPELGDEEGLRALSRALRERRMGLLLDIVPNHMAATQENPYWWDVLTYGRASACAGWFDIDWNAPEEELRGRVLLPVLGASLREVLERGEITLVMEGGAPVVAYHEHRFPLDPRTLPAAGTGTTILSRFTADATGRARLRRLLDRQAYRLAYWRRAAAEINYRRFFNINDLVGLRVEDPQVFEATHRLVLDWVAAGVVDGLRIDHVDGLRDPAGYLRRLREAVNSRRPPSDTAQRFPIVVEKILSAGEQLRAAWPVEGTTGYEVLNDLEAVLLDADGYDGMEARYRSLLDLGRRGVDFPRVALAGKRRVLRGVLAADVQRLTRLLRPVARDDSRTAALRSEALERAVIELMARLPVYRTYVDATGWTPDAGPPATPEDRVLVDGAVAAASGPGEVDRGALALLRELLLLEGAGTMPAPELRRRMRFTGRFQQVSPPAAAKGVEDTALYLYHPLASRNEVGADPDRPLATAVELFHQANTIRARDWPRALTCVSTHDTKRGADTRSRLDVLSQLPAEWWGAVTRWRQLNAPLRRRIRRREAPDVNTEYLLFQSLVGIWPVDPSTTDARTSSLPDPDVLHALEERMQEYALKAVREGKSRSSWLRPDEEFERALHDYLHAALDPSRSAPFLTGVDSFARRVARTGWWSSLARTLLQLTVPGVPDSYQGDELWQHTLVDPDNRRPVDFDLRSTLLAELERAWHDRSPEERPSLARSLLDAPEDGRVKLFLTWRALVARREWPGMLRDGGYLPLEGSGPRAAHVVAFARTAADGGAVVIIAPRLSLHLAGGGPPLGVEAWGETVVLLPPELAGRRWRSALTDRALDGEGGEGEELRVADAIRDLPGALLVAQGSG